MTANDRKLNFRGFEYVSVYSEVGANIFIKSAVMQRHGLHKKRFKWEELQLADSTPLHILVNYNLPLNRALALINFERFI